MRNKRTILWVLTLVTAMLFSMSCGLFAQTADENDIFDVRIASDSAKGTDKATIGDTVTLTFSSNSAIEKTSNFTINGKAVTALTKTADYTYAATYTVTKDDAITGQAIPFNINVKNANGIQYFTVRETSDKSAVTIVDPRPAISEVSFVSNNKKDAKLAKTGDTVTLTFKTDVAVWKLSNFKINGSNPDTFTNEGNVYTATHLVDKGDKFTGEPMTFQINVRSGGKTETANDLYSQTIETTNDESSVTLIDERPAISDVSIRSNSAKGKDKATIGDTVTLTFKTDVTVWKLSNFKINGSNPDTFTNEGNVYTATHKVDDGDKLTGEPATFQINVRTGGKTETANDIYSQTVEVTNDKSSVTIVDQKPAISDVNISSDSAKGKDKATVGDTITLTFKSDEPIGKLGNFKINGSNPDTFTNDGNVYTATHKVDDGDKITGKPVTFQINVKNKTGIYSQTIETTNDDSQVIVIVPIPFTDVKEGSWDYNAIMYVYQNELMVGTGDDTFSGNVATNRSMLVTILWRMDGSPVEAPKTKFTDVKEAYYTNAVAWASNHGIALGYGNGLFGPNDNVTREQMVAMFQRYAEYKDAYDASKAVSLDSYPDQDKILFAKDAFAWAVGVGMIHGVPQNNVNYLAPQGLATRSEVATLVQFFSEELMK